MRPHICSDEAHRIAFGFSPPDDPYFATRLRDGLGERGRHAPPVKDRAAAARLASSGSGRLRDMPRRTQGECGSWSRRHGRRFSRDEDAASRTRQWQSETPLGRRQKHHAPVRGQPTAIEGSCDSLGLNGWKRNGKIVASVMAGMAFAVEGDASQNQILRRISTLHHARQPRRRPLANRAG